MREGEEEERGDEENCEKARPTHQASFAWKTGEMGCVGVLFSRFSLSICVCIYIFSWDLFYEIGELKEKKRKFKEKDDVTAFGALLGRRQGFRSDEGDLLFFEAKKKRKRKIVKGDVSLAINSMNKDFNMHFVMIICESKCEGTFYWKDFHTCDPNK